MVYCHVYITRSLLATAVAVALLFTWGCAPAMLNYYGYILEVDNNKAIGFADVRLEGIYTPGIQVPLGATCPGIRAAGSNPANLDSFAVANGALQVVVDEIQMVTTDSTGYFRFDVKPNGLESRYNFTRLRINGDGYRDTYYGVGYACQDHAQELSITLEKSL